MKVNITFNHSKFGKLSKFKLSHYLELLAYIMNRINLLEVWEVENPPNDNEYQKAALKTLDEIIKEKERIESILINKELKTLNSK